MSTTTPPLLKWFEQSIVFGGIETRPLLVTVTLLLELLDCGFTQLGVSAVCVKVPPLSEDGKRHR